MRKRLKKRFARKLSNEFKNAGVFRDGGLRLSYVSGMNSKPWVTKKQAYEMSRVLGGHWKSYTKCEPIIIGFEEEEDV